MDMSVQRIYQTKLAEIQKRIPTNVKTNFSSVLNDAVQNTKNDEIEKLATDSDDNNELLKNISQMIYTNSIMENSSSSLLSSSSNSDLGLPSYNTNTALSLALSKMMKNGN